MGDEAASWSVGSLANLTENAVFDKVLLLNQVEEKALSLEKEHRGGATVTCRAMYL